MRPAHAQRLLSPRRRIDSHLARATPEIAASSPAAKPNHSGRRAPSPTVRRTANTHESGCGQHCDIHTPPVSAAAFVFWHPTDWKQLTGREAPGNQLADRPSRSPCTARRASPPLACAGESSSSASPGRGEPHVWQARRLAAPPAPARALHTLQPLSAPPRGLRERGAGAGCRRVKADGTLAFAVRRR